MTTYEKLRSRIVELIPEIVELKFGCEIERWSDSEKCFVTQVDERGMVEYFHPTIPDPAALLEHEFEIIGRPITLEDCMRAMNSELYRFDDFYLTDSEDNSVKWIPGKPLEQQDEETLLFISKILEK